MLVPIDHSEPADAALHLAARLARPAQGLLLVGIPSDADLGPYVGHFDPRAAPP